MGFRAAPAWAVVKKTEPGGSCVGTHPSSVHPTLDEAFAAVLEHDSTGCWAELVHGIWEIGRDELEGRVRGDWFVMKYEAVVLPVDQFDRLMAEADAECSGNADVPRHTESGNFPNIEESA
ncbi:hypothetical protein [Nocardia sp. NPDC051833]|uniref:hypothetical protein n=1 Tax=Nocardia sp. NPDC051833 TaxID=3155674 RepID=UPI0034298800